MNITTTQTMLAATCEYPKKKNKTKNQPTTQFNVRSLFVFMASGHIKYFLPVFFILFYIYLKYNNAYGN
jgi:heme/copper-type cytochrome/quinol oxidase subunit 2